MDKDPKLRPLYLAQILYERTDEDHYLTTAELMEILEKEHGFKVHRQTIPADVAALRSFGMEIQEVMSSQKRYNLISREYDIAEIKLLIDAVESSKFITKKKSEELVAKLSKMAGRNQAEQLRRNISAEDRIKYDNESIYLIIDGINEAINAGKKISFLYFKYDVRKEPKLRNDGKPWQAGLERRFLLHGRRVRQQEGRDLPPGPDTEASRYSGGGCSSLPGRL